MPTRTRRREGGREPAQVRLKINLGIRKIQDQEKQKINPKIATYQVLVHGDPTTPEWTKGGEDNEREKEEKNGDGVTAHVQGGKPHWASLSAAGVVGPEIVNNDRFLISTEEIRRICILPSFIVVWMPPPFSRIEAVFSCLRKSCDHSPVYDQGDTSPDQDVKRTRDNGNKQGDLWKKISICHVFSQILYLFVVKGVKGLSVNMCCLNTLDRLQILVLLLEGKKEIK